MYDAVEAVVLHSPECGGWLVYEGPPEHAWGVLQHPHLHNSNPQQKCHPLLGAAQNASQACVWQMKQSLMTDTAHAVPQ